MSFVVRADLAQNQISEFPRASASNMVSAGGGHTVLLRNDGQAVAFGWNEYRRCNVPPLDQGITYTQVSAGSQHTVLLRSDGQAVAFGCRAFGRCSIPPLDKGISYTQVSAGGCHTVLLRSDGEAVACGSGDGIVVAAASHGMGQCSIPPLTEWLLYTQVSAGMNHTVLLRSDGKAVLAGRPQRMGDARYRLWIKEFHTPRCLQVVAIQYFSEAMAPLWPAEVMTRGSASFHY